MNSQQLLLYAQKLKLNSIEELVHELETKLVHFFCWLFERKKQKSAKRWVKYKTMFCTLMTTTALWST